MRSGYEGLRNHELFYLRRNPVLVDSQEFGTDKLPHIHVANLCHVNPTPLKFSLVRAQEPRTCHFHATMRGWWSAPHSTAQKGPDILILDAEKEDLHMKRDFDQK